MSEPTPESTNKTPRCANPCSACKCPTNTQSTEERYTLSDVARLLEKKWEVR